MNDAECECVQLKSSENCLNAFEEEMKSAQKNFTREVLAAALKKKKKKREQWIGDFPAQVIHTANQIQWTQKVTNVLKGQKTLRFEAHSEQIHGAAQQMNKACTRTNIKVTSPGCFMLAGQII